jgi:hypothetical protein
VRKIGGRGRRRDGISDGWSPLSNQKGREQL